MTRLLAVWAVALLMFAACNDSDEELPDPTQSPTAAASDVPVSTSPPVVHTSTATPEPTAQPTRTLPPEPDEQQINDATSLHQVLPELPDNGNWKIVWTGDPVVGMFQVIVGNASTNDEFIDWMQQAKQWFADQGHDPCGYPLAGLIGYTSTGAYPPAPTDPDWLQQPWEPCSDSEDSR